MKIETTWDNLKSISWEAVFRAADDYRKKYPGDKIGHDYQHNHEHYNEYMMSTWGIEHTATSMKIVDEQKYLMLLLKFG